MRFFFLRTLSLFAIHNSDSHSAAPAAVFAVSVPAAGVVPGKSYALSLVVMIILICEHVQIAADTSILLRRSSTIICHCCSPTSQHHRHFRLPLTSSPDSSLSHCRRYLDAVLFMMT
ncbi:uncharacterized protein LOC130993325 isoform X2 [Salvia miltiorrhiza]|uniref:uncharacterized protein LOC130993325 isoform X2 n=1 Tax=Salvia miltiorrhiza TaxID=226208 RepID=UPI0025ACDFE6|nr:uncharacterized protein LOC130993325 isoform X2 [Salvia miltiorrhiza]